MENFPYLFMVFHILMYDFSQQMGTYECMENFPAAHGKYQYVYRTFKGMEEKQYFRIERFMIIFYSVHNNY